MALAIGIGALIGHYLDGKFETHPWLFFIFLSFGIIAAFRLVCAFLSGNGR